MDKKEYLTSERFIHDNLILKANQLFKLACEQWEKEGLRSSFAFMWPAVIIKSDNGTPIDGPMILPLDDERRLQWNNHMVIAVTRTEAYGLLFIERTDKGIVGTFESKHGSFAWKRELERRGDRNVLAPVIGSQDKEHLGILWRPQHAKA